MTLGSKIWIFNKTIVGLERDDYGVYEILDRSDNILYIGQGSIRSSLLKHFPDGKHPISGAFNFSVEYTWDEEKSRKRHREELVKFHKENNDYPKFNNGIHFNR